MEMTNDNDEQGGAATDIAVTKTPDQEGATQSALALVQKIQQMVRGDRAFHSDAFRAMREDMHLARKGCTKDHPKDHYVANLVGRHVKQKTAALYAKNPRATAKRRETLDFTVWDENPSSIKVAMDTLMQAEALMGQLPIDPGTGQPLIDETDPTIQKALIAFQSATAIVEDFKQGMERRTYVQKIGRTLEIVYSHALQQQKPVDFKTGMKQLVRRASTTGVGYIELGFQREKGPRPGTEEKLADFQARLAHLKNLASRVNDPENPIMPDDPEIEELEKASMALAEEAEIVLREGLIIDFPQATKVIPDRLCRSLVGFIGARHVTIEYSYTPEQVKEIFDVDVGAAFSAYVPDAKNPVKIDKDQFNEDDAQPAKVGEKGSLVCVWKTYDRVSGLVYYTADGYPQWLREPGKPDVFVEDFIPVYALTFNEVEDEDTLFPPSDARLMQSQQMEYNRSRQGMREHRKAARPRWTYMNGAFGETDAKNIATLEPFEMLGINGAPGSKLSDILDAVPVSGVDPNLYETGQLFTDIQMVVGSSEAQFGGTAQATATESAIAANAMSSSDNSSIDDLDAFLTCVARASGQILLREMSTDQVMKIAGPGAVWPEMTLEDIASEIYLEVEAGSTGKPNQAIEIKNMQQMLPFLLQMPELDKMWLAKEVLRRLDDRMDLTDAFAAGAPSIMAQNAMAQVSTGDPANAPTEQGAAGAQNAPTQTEQQAGSDPAFGSNQV